jgi:hypothetical protein
VSEWSDERSAYDEEIRLIAHYGRKNLVNGSDGGDGVRNMPPESKARMIAAQSARMTPENKKKLSERMKDTKISDATKLALRKANLGRSRTGEKRTGVALENIRAGFKITNRRRVLRRIAQIENGTPLTTWEHNEDVRREKKVLTQLGRTLLCEALLRKAACA